MSEESKKYLGQALDAVRNGDHDAANDAFSNAIKDHTRTIINPPEPQVDVNAGVDNTE